MLTRRRDAVFSKSHTDHFVYTRRSPRGRVPRFWASHQSGLGFTVQKTDTGVSGSDTVLQLPDPLPEQLVLPPPHALHPLIRGPLAPHGLLGRECIELLPCLVVIDHQREGVLLPR